MDKHLQQLDLQALVDWLAEETQQYTRAFISSASNATILRHKEMMEMLIAEIRRRKKEDALPPGLMQSLPPNDFFETNP
jgi:hypothetical protein